jgi:hypothetical protein
MGLRQLVKELKANHIAANVLVLGEKSSAFRISLVAEYPKPRTKRDRDLRRNTGPIFLDHMCEHKCDNDDERDSE